MKKILLIFLSVVLIAGVVALGFVVFNSKSIASAQIDGTMQTLYVAGQDIDFEDAKLKITYKNGNIKMIDMDNKNVKISQFSTSLKTHGTMKITYKNQVLDVEYDVIEAGLYYLSNKEVVTASDSTPTTKEFDYKSSNLLIYLRANGECDYYAKDDAGRYLMHDGSYDKSYNYTISGDTLKVNLGSTDNVIKIKADYNKEGNVFYKSEKVTTNTAGLEVSKTTDTYTHYEMKSDFYRTITSSSIDFTYATSVDNNVIVFNQGENIKTSGQTILLKCTYSNDDFLTDVYVHVCDEMISNNSLYTEEKTSIDTMRIFYKKGDTSTDVSVHYKVV